MGKLTQMKDDRSSAFVPNTFQTPNLLIDTYGYYLTSEEIRVWIYACRHILGWADSLTARRRPMSLSMFVNGYETKNGKKYMGCGLCRGAVIKALEGLERYGLLKKVGIPNEHGQTWEIPVDDSNIDLTGLQERRTDTEHKNKSKTEKARIEADSQRVHATDQSMPQTRTGPCDRLESVCGTDHNRSVGQTTTGLCDRHKQTHIQTHNQTHGETQRKARSLSVPNYWNFLPEIKTWWDNVAIPLYKAKYSWGPGHLPSGPVLEELLKQAEALGLSVVAAKYENFLKDDKKWFAEQSHAIGVFIRCIGQFPGEVKRSSGYGMSEDESRLQLLKYQRKTQGTNAAGQIA